MPGSVAIQTAALERYPLEHMLKVAAGLGLREIELHSCHLPHVTPDIARSVRQVIERHGLKVAGYVWSRAGVKPWWKPVGFTPFEQHGFESSLQCIKDNLDIAQALGVPYMTVFETAKTGDVVDEEAWRNLVRVFREGAKAAEARGVKLVNEFHPGMFASTEERAVRLIDEIGSPWFSACLDLCHAFVITGGNPLRFIGNLGNRIGHVHLASADGAPHLHVPLGAGLVDVKGCLHLLSELGYSGPWSLCLYGYPCPEDGISSSLSFLEIVGRNGR